MKIIKKTAALNMLADGSNQGSTLATIETQRQSVGVYVVTGVTGMAAEGWQTTIKENENGDKTISLSTEATEGGVIVRTFERGTTTPTDIIGALTLRFDVEIEVEEEPEQQ